MQRVSVVKRSETRASDPFTVVIIQNAVQAICDEMRVTMQKTALSPIIYEVLDFGVGVLDAQGQLTCQGFGIPVFVGMLEAGVQEVLRKFTTAGAIRTGDVFITNDPHRGGVSHLNDVVMLMPVFHEETLVGWLSNKAHWGDIGGAVPGGISHLHEEVYQEGLIFPEVKLVDGGTPLQSVIDMIAANSRVPETTLGDMWAMIAALRAGTRQLQEICAKYGIETVAHTMDSMLAYGESISLAALRTLEPGTYRAEERMDNGGTVRVTVTITPTEFIVDLSENEGYLPGPFNCPRLNAVVGAEIAFKGLTSPESNIANAGTFRPLKVITRPGTLFHSEPPKAAGVYIEGLMMSMDLVWKAVAGIAPARVGAGHFGTVGATIFAFKHPDHGHMVVTVEPMLGGWGAGPDGDGTRGQFCAADGDTFLCPVEVSEMRNGMFIERLELRCEPGGEGEYCGGKGIVLDYRIRSAEAFLTIFFARTNGNPPWSLAGGREGTVNDVQIHRTDGRVEHYSRVGHLPLARGDLVRFITGAGGGYGDPKRRPRELVLADVEDGFVSLETAAHVFGQSVD